MSTYFERRMAEIAAEKLRKQDAVEPERPRKPLPEPKVARDLSQPGYVYFFRAGNRVKIGFTINLPQRLRSLQTGCPERAFICKVVPGTMLTERRYHARYAPYRAAGEWFELEGRLAKFLERDIYPIDLPAPMAKQVAERERIIL